MSVSRTILLPADVSVSRTILLPAEVSVYRTILLPAEVSSIHFDARVCVLTQSACTYWATIGSMDGCRIQVDVGQTMVDQRWSNML